MKTARLLKAWLLVLSLLALGTVRTPPASLPAPPVPVAAARARVIHVTKPGPLHLVICKQRERLKVFTSRGCLIFTCKAKNDAINLGFCHFGCCPPGTYGMAAPMPVGTPAFGPYFIKLLDLSPDGPFHRFHRHGIGLHGGGSRLPEPFARWQGWSKTHGCFRLQNHDLLIVVRLLHTNRTAGCRPLTTVQ